jgi:plastocyanin
MRSGHDHTFMRDTILAALAAATVLAGCGGGDDTKSAATTTGPRAAGAAVTHAIRIVNFIYEPDPAMVRAGRRITISNTDRAPHTVTQKGTSPSFDSGTVEGGKRGSVTFSKPGTYEYFCQFHPTMKGTVTVTG